MFDSDTCIGLEDITRKREGGGLEIVPPVGCGLSIDSIFINSPLHHFRTSYTANGDLLENSFVSMETKLFSPGS